MQSGSRSGDGTAFLRVDGLVAVAIGAGVVAIDIGRQRNVSDLFDQGEEIIDGGETDVTFAKGAARENLGS